MKTVILAGSSGLVGSLVLQNLLSDSRIEKIILVSRTKQDFVNPKIIQVITSLDLLENINLADHGIDSVDVGICTLGTTIKKSGGAAAFKKVDKDFVIAFAQFSKNCGAQKFGVISALGANSHSSVFYNKVKGEMEEGLRQIKFTSLFILRPSLILGERKEVRVVEKLFIKLSPFLSHTLIGPLKKFRGIEANRLACHLTESIFNDSIGVTIIENAQMLTI
jgi:uncharacterized protein YbjT (DUF2867 family)